MTEEQTSNPTPTDAQAEDGVFGSGDSFFDALDNEVNGVVTDESTSGKLHKQENQKLNR